ncbi:MAG: hypothetical protein GEV07_22770 [Streptosporangiales bacterium]|nr:hypothetical protein [Streptosporangiales bacterium]
MSDHYRLADSGTDDEVAAGPPAVLRKPWRVFLALVPLVAILAAVAGAIGYGYGESTGTRQVRKQLASTEPANSESPRATPAKPVPEPFISSMPRPMRTGLRAGATPQQVVGPEFDASQPTRTLSPNVPFSFRAPKGKWTQRTPHPLRDIAYASAFYRPSGDETAKTSPLYAAFAWRACGKCSLSDVPEFDQRFREFHGTPDFELEQKSDHTAYDEVTDGETHYLVVRHVFESPDGNTYLIDYLVRAPAAEREQAQQLANEILTQSS